MTTCATCGQPTNGHAVYCPPCLDKKVLDFAKLLYDKYTYKVGSPEGATILCNAEKILRDYEKERM